MKNLYKKKAEELIFKFKNKVESEVKGFGSLKLGKECALIAVEEIISLGCVPKNKQSILIYDFYCKVKIEIINY